MGGVPTTQKVLSTESNGGFRNIAISNCVIEGSKGIAIQTDDGALIEGIAISNMQKTQLCRTLKISNYSLTQTNPKGKTQLTVRAATATA